MSLVRIENMSVEFGAAGDAFRAVDSVNMQIDEGTVIFISKRHATIFEEISRAVIIEKVHRINHVTRRSKS